MTEVSSRHQVEELLEGTVDRGNFQEIARGVYSSFRTVDWAGEFLRDLIAAPEAASGQQQRDLHEKIGILSFMMCNYSQATEHLSAVKSRSEAAHFLGRTLIELSDAKGAIEALELGRRGEDDLQTDMLIVEMLCVQRDSESARKLCARHEKTGGDDPEWLYGMGRVLEVEGAYEEAMAHFEKALEARPDHLRSLFRLALNCDLNGEDERAAGLYETCASLNPTCVGALLNLGVLYEDAGRYSEAIDCYKRVLAIDPSHKRAQLFLKDAEAGLTMHVDEETTRRIRALDETLKLSLSNFELSARSRNALEKLNVRTLEDLTRTTEEHLLQFKNFGETSLEEIKDLLARNELELRGSRPPAKPEAKQLTASPQEKEDLQEKLSMPVELLGLSTRSRKCMDRLKIITVDELVRHTEQDLLAVPNFGRTSVAEIKSKLEAHGLALLEETSA